MTEQKHGGLRRQLAGCFDGSKSLLLTLTGETLECGGAGLVASANWARGAAASAAIGQEASW